MKEDVRQSSSLTRERLSSEYIDVCVALCEEIKNSMSSPDASALSVEDVIGRSVDIIPKEKLHNLNKFLEVNTTGFRSAPQLDKLNKYLVDVVTELKGFLLAEDEVLQQKFREVYETPSFLLLSLEEQQ